MKQAPGFLTESFAKAIIPTAVLGQPREQRAPDSKKPQGQAPVV